MPAASKVRQGQLKYPDSPIDHRESSQRVRSCTERQSELQTTT
ncbi:unnamed protein product [Ectocarpus sp. CCAP 1310/34]|nr:unnamed protein product [Ectocarpus sp. CCAP 1310/34]